MTHDVVDRIGERADAWESPEERIEEQRAERRLRFLRWSVPVLLTVALLVAGYRGLDVGVFDPEILLVNAQVDAVDPDESWVEVTSFSDQLLTGVSHVHTVQTGGPRTVRWFWQLGTGAMPHTFVDVTIDEPCLDQRAYVTDHDWTEEHPLPVRSGDVSLRGASVAWLVLEATTTSSCLAPRGGSDRFPTVVGLPHPVIAYRSTALPMTRTISTAGQEDAELVNLTDDLDAVRACLRDPSATCSFGYANRRG